MTDSTGPATPSERTTPWRAIAAVGGAILLAIVVIAALALRDNGSVGHRASSGPGRGSGSPVRVGVTRPPPFGNNPHHPSTPATLPSPSPRIAPAALPENWTEAAWSLPRTAGRYVVGDLVAWSGGLVAAGAPVEVRNEGTGSVFGPPPQHAGRVWRSTDGP